jgi:hypothetical protein
MGSSGMRMRLGARLRDGAVTATAVAVVLLAVSAVDARAGSGASGPADLLVRAVSDPPERAFPGTSFSVSDVVVNDGGRKAGDSTTEYFLTAGRRRQPVGERHVEPLPPGAESAAQAQLTIRASIADGTYALLACADENDDVDESDEDNNCRTASRRVVIDTTPPPVPAIDAHPEDPSAQIGARFEFSDAEAGVGFTCRIDDEQFAACDSPHDRTGLGEGTHRFEVRARDAAGNDSEPAAFTWTIDLTAPPAPEIGERPGTVTSANEAGFSFSEAEPGVEFECALDDEELAPCESPQYYTGLEDGDHAFTVAARDAAGNKSASARFEWTIVPDELTLGDGAWSWFADPRAIRFNQHTYVGWVARDGDIKVSAFDHGLLSRTTALVAPAVQVDDHANPALQILPDGRIRVYYSAHTGSQLWYRTSLAPEDVSAWEPARTMPTNTSGGRGYTYPNPINLPDEQATYLFWRGGNYNPTFSIQADGSDAWTAPRTLISVPNQRPYVKYDSNDSDSIAVAFTNAHPREAADVNIYFAAYRDGALHRADGTPIGTLSAPITPAAADKVYDGAENAWVHDVAIGPDGRPVIVFAAFPSQTDHRYMYARWTGSEWAVHQITPAGGSFNPQANEYYYSGGITLDHEDPSRVYLSRQIGDVFEVETWTTPDGGVSWPETEVSAVTAGSTVKNVRPVSPRGLTPFWSDLSVLWMRGVYNSYIDYHTSITTILLTGGNAPPVADATLTPRTGPAPQMVAFDAGTSSDPDGTIDRYEWDFGDGTDGSGRQTEHTYRQPGRYFPTLTVVDDAGARDRFVAEVVIEPPVPPDVWTGPATDLDGSSATLRGTVNPHNQQTTYHFEFGTTTAYESRTPDQELAEGENVDHAARARLTDLAPGEYHYRLVATNASRTVAGGDRVFSVPPQYRSPYRDGVLATPGLAGYWRLGELDGPVARDETGAHPGAFSAAGVRLGEAGALFDDDWSAGFDGKSGEMTAPASVPASAATVEGWFDWRAGTAVMRDHTSTTGVGWILAYESNGLVAWRVAGRAFTTSRTVASLRGAWHHIAITMNGGAVAFYLDGQLVQSGTVSVPRDPVLPWHVMRNGNSPTEYTQGRADEIAVYDTALSPAQIAEHHRKGATRA